MAKAAKKAIITVDEERQKLLSNGLVDLKRDIIMKLFRIIQDGKKIQSIMGMMREFYPWISQRIFMKIQSQHIPSFMPNSKGNCEIVQLKKECHFKDEVRTVFLDTVVSKGILRWTVKVKYTTEKESVLNMGIAPKENTKYYEEMTLGYFYPEYLHGGCSLRFWRRSSDGAFAACLRGVKDFSDTPEPESQVPDEATVSLEVNVEGKLINYFVDEKKIPHGINHIPVPFRFGMSGCQASFTSLSFRRLASATKSAVTCKYHECKEPKGKVLEEK